MTTVTLLDAPLVLPELAHVLPPKLRSERFRDAHIVISIDKQTVFPSSIWLHIKVIYIHQGAERTLKFWQDGVGNSPAWAPLETIDYDSEEEEFAEYLCEIFNEYYVA